MIMYTHSYGDSFMIEEICTAEDGLPNPENFRKRTCIEWPATMSGK